MVLEIDNDQLPIRFHVKKDVSSKSVFTKKVLKNDAERIGLSSEAG